MIQPDLPSRLCVVLVRSRNPLNIGAAARAVSNFGFEHLRLVNPYDVAFREARSAVGASAVLGQAEEYKDLVDAIADCELVVGTTAGKNRKLYQPFVELKKAATLIGKANGRIALLFGSEKRGLSNEDLNYCHWLLRIPTVEPQLSMNMGQAVAVCLYELTRKPSPAPKTVRLPPAATHELELLTDLLTESLYKSGYMNLDRKASTQQQLRRLFRRLSVSSDDARVLLGMVRQLARKS